MRCSLKPTRNADFSTESIGAAMRKWATYMESARESVAPTRSETNQYFESARIRANRWIPIFINWDKNKNFVAANISQSTHNLGETNNSVVNKFCL